MERAVLGRHHIERWPTTVFVDVENVFYWTGGTADTDRGRTLDQVTRTAFDRPVRSMGRWGSDAARTAAVFGRLVDWVEQHLGTSTPADAPSSFDLRTYGEAGDLAVKALDPVRSHWVHVGVSGDENAADVALTADLRDRSRRTDPQCFVVACSDGDVLRWAHEAATTVGDLHQYLAILGPDLPHPGEFATGGKYARLTWLTTVSEMFGDVVRAERDERAPVRSPTPDQLHFRAGQVWRRLESDGLMAELRSVLAAEQFIAQVRRRLGLLPLVKDLSVRARLAAGMPTAVYDAWCAGHSHDRSGPPGYAVRRLVEQTIRQTHDLPTVRDWEDLLDHALRQQDRPDDDLAHLRRRVAEATARIGPRSAGDST